MTSVRAQDLLLRAPSNRVHRIPAGEEFVMVSALTADQVCGQWLVYSDTPKTKFSGVFRSSRMESVTGALLFSVEMKDTGEEYAVILREMGVTVICIQLSPPKCPISTYHRYLNSYCRILGMPAPGDRSVAGDESPDGRAPSPEEFTFRFIRSAVRVVNAAGLVKAELSRHARGRGGESGIDAFATLQAWKARADWYALAPGTEDEFTLTIGAQKIRPLRAVRRESLGTNLFTGAASTALFSLALAISRGPLGGMAAVLLNSAGRRLRALDAGTTMTEPEAWVYLETARLPPRSSILARKLVEFRQSLTQIFPHAPRHSGKMPFLLAPPELIFQDFVTAKCLLALGLPHTMLAEGIKDSHTPAGCRFGSLIAWADTPFHELQGWRDGTGKPAGYEPDLVVVDTHMRRTILLDAKFRRDTTGLLPASGIKDMQAYMHEYELSNAVVAVPSISGDPLAEDVSAKGFRVRGIAFSPEIEEAE